MSTITKRDTAPRDRGSADHRLARLLDTPLLAQVVPHLAPETLRQLIQYRGLEACGEIVTSATPAQLTSLLDLDLWCNARPGQDEQFNVDRFGEWIEVLVDTGQSAAARIVAALDTNLVVAGLSRYLRVFDPGIFEPTAQSDDEQMDRHEAMREGDALEAGDWSGDRLTCEVGGYIVRARRGDAWDASVALLFALDAEHPDCFHALMQGCRLLSNSRPEIGGLDDLLMAPEQHLHDIAMDREQRRSQQGYATPADARAFLQMARQPRAAWAPNAKNPIATAYFREVAPALAEASTRQGCGDDAIPKSIDAIIELLIESGHLRQGYGGQGVTPQRPRALLEAADDDPRAQRLPLLKRLMEFVRRDDETTYVTRGRELAFLANTLLSGSSVQSRPFTPREASDAASCICNLGLECSMPPDAFLIDHDLVTAFEAGWSVLYRDVSLFVTDQLISTLARLHCADADTRRELVLFERNLVKQRDAGTPWLAREAADVLAILDMTAWISVIGLLDECPILPAALTAVLERRTTRVSPTAFEFISTSAEIGDIRVFMKMLPGVLSG
jgi:hypothetical protein